MRAVSRQMHRGEHTPLHYCKFNANKCFLRARRQLCNTPAALSLLCSVGKRERRLDTHFHAHSNRVKRAPRYSIIQLHSRKCAVTILMEQVDCVRRETSVAQDGEFFARESQRIAGTIEMVRKHVTDLHEIRPRK